MSNFFQIVDESTLKRKTSTHTQNGGGSNEVIMKTVGPRRMTSEAAATAERINASMDQVNLSDDENSPQRRANIRGKHFSEKLFFVYMDFFKLELCIFQCMSQKVSDFELEVVFYHIKLRP